jgi:hypothetical protein
MSSDEQRGLRGADIRRAGRHLATAFYATALVVAISAAVPLFDRYEAKFFPVVRDFRILEFRQEADSVLIDGDMRKVRDCGFVEVVFYVGSAEHDDMPREMLGVEFLDQKTGAPISREPGYQPWGPWRIGRPRTLSGPDIFMRVTHKCHWLYPTKGIYYIAKRARFFGE